MPDFNNPIEKYNQEDRKIFSFFSKVSSFATYVIFTFYGGFVGAIIWLLFGLSNPIHWYVAIGLFTGLGCAKLNILMIKKFGDELPIVWLLLFGCLIVTGFLCLITI